MKRYIILLNDSNLINSCRDSLIRSCSKYIKTNPDNFDVYQSFIFAEGTGYMKKVSEEIDFVLQCNKHTLDSSVEDFARNWKLTEYLNYDIIDLSGGWRKFLGLALFTNILSNNKIFFDICRHLGDDLIFLFKKNLNRSLTHNVFFLEYDINLIRDANMIPIFYHGDELHNDFITLIKSNLYTDSNYEQFA